MTNQTFNEKNKERITIFLWQWFNIHGLCLYDMTPEVVGFVKVEFWCNVDQFVKLLTELKEGEFVTTTGNMFTDCHFTEKGTKYVDDLVAKHGMVNFNVKFPETNLIY